MNKIGLIFKREYLTRVRNKTFLLSTFLLPLVFIALIAGITVIAIKTKKTYRVAVYDPGRYFKGLLKDTKDVQFGFVTAADTAAAVYQKQNYNGIIVLPSGWAGTENLGYDLRSPKQFGAEAADDVNDQMNDAIRNRLLQQQGISPARLDTLRSQAPKAVQRERSMSDTGEKTTSSGFSSIIGLVSGVLLYIMMLIYGTMVMRGVMEEKTSRIAEVIVSSVKPMQLMVGKITGIGAVGLTQFLLWLILIFGLTALAQLFIPHDTMVQVQQAQQQAGGMPGSGGMSAAAMQASQSNSFLAAAKTANWPLIIGCFAFYFLGGYLFYAALFAAVGCMVNEDPQDAQSLTLPIMMPIIFGFFIMQTTLQNPDSSLAVWASMIPFTSPIVMMARIPSEPPAWQIGLSMVLLIGGFLATGWMAGKIYRTGILMYGKKGTWKQMMRWVFAKS